MNKYLANFSTILLSFPLIVCIFSNNDYYLLVFVSLSGSHCDMVKYCYIYMLLSHRVCVAMRAMRS